MRRRPGTGHPTAVETVGQGPRRLLMLHCSLARHQSLLPLARLLGGEYTVTLIDLPGHGDRPMPPDGIDIHDLATVTASDVMGAGAFDVFGHSFGATVALRLAVERPDDVGRATLCEPVYFAALRGTPGWDAYRLGMAPFRAALTVDPADATRLFHAAWGTGRWADLPPWVRDDMAGRIGAVEAGTLAIEDDRAGILSRLGGLEADVTLIRGGATDPSMPQIHAALASRIRRCRDIVVPHAGHMLPVTHPSAVAAAMGITPSAVPGTGRRAPRSSTSRRPAGR